MVGKEIMLVQERDSHADWGIDILKSGDKPSGEKGDKP